MSIIERSLPLDGHEDCRIMFVVEQLAELHTNKTTSKTFLCQFYKIRFVLIFLSIEKNAFQQQTKFHKTE
jgi:hypothetical protein